MLFNILANFVTSTKIEIYFLSTKLLIENKPHFLNLVLDLIQNENNHKVYLYAIEFYLNLLDTLALSTSKLNCAKPDDSIFCLIL